MIIHKTVVCNAGKALAQLKSLYLNSKQNQMGTEFDKIKEAKTKEAKDLFETLGIAQEQEEERYFSEIPTYFENSNPEENQESKFHWTRLSINSSSGCIID